MNVAHRVLVSAQSGASSVGTRGGEGQGARLLRTAGDDVSTVLAAHSIHVTTKRLRSQVCQFATTEVLILTEPKNNNPFQNTCEA